MGFNWANTYAQGYKRGEERCIERKENLMQQGNLWALSWDSEVKADWILTITLFKKSQWWDGKTKYFLPSVDVLSLMESYHKDLLALFPYFEIAKKLSRGILHNLLVQMLSLYSCTVIVLHIVLERNIDLDVINNRRTRYTWVRGLNVW